MRDKIEKLQANLKRLQTLGPDTKIRGMDAGEMLETLAAAWLELDSRVASIDKELEEWRL